MDSSEKHHASERATSTAADARSTRSDESGATGNDVFADAQQRYDCLEQLERSSLQLAHRDGMSVTDISETLGEGPGVIRQALRNGLLKLSLNLR
ncbi:MAG: hypothetical protein WBO97_11135 [Tepidiformaceae bacterium]